MRLLCLPIYLNLYVYIYICRTVKQSYGETCGIYLADFQPISNEKVDVTHETVEHLQLSQKISPSSLIIKNELAQSDIHPDNSDR